MNIAIVGSNGYIAGYLRKELANHAHTILKIDKEGEDVQKLDLEHPEEFKYTILDSIDFLVFTAAVSGPDKCAEEFDFCWKVNVDGTKYFIREAMNRGCRVLFFSSDAVYGDIPGYIYTEDSETRASTAYGRMKKAVEDEFKDAPYFRAIRLSYVMSANDRFISYCLKCLKSGEVADVFHPFYRNVISVTDVARVVLWFADHYEEYKPKFLNVTGQELVSRVRMADEINRIFDHRLRYTITRPTESFFKNRPAITQMRSLYLEKYGILENESFTKKIQRELKDVEI